MRDIPHEVKEINHLLIDHFGIDTSTGQPIWRVSWSDDQYEMRKTDRTEEGLQLLHPEVIKRSKYSYIKARWILEQLQVVPDSKKEELSGLKLSYECLYVFEADNGDALPPMFEACEFAIHLVNAARGKGNLSKYKENPEADRIRVDKLHQELFGNENDTTDALAYGEGIGYTGPSKIEPVKES